MKDIEKRLQAIEKRNARVEADKDWETSIFRRVALTLLTYIVIYVYLIFIDQEDPGIVAVVPALGYFLSTLVMSSLKNWWVQK